MAGPLATFVPRVDSETNFALSKLRQDSAATSSEGLRVQRATITALESTNYFAAESMQLQAQIDSIAPGLVADIIVVAGDPLKNITAVRHVTFAMKHGVIYKNDVSARLAK
jgi:imidazolonepropionase-like amidohydrolase